MIRFTIYSFLFKPINEPLQKDAFAPDVNAEESMKNKLQLFGNLFLPNNGFKFKSKSQCYEHMLVAKEKGIIILKIANNTHPERERNFNRWKEEDHPSLYVLIDNREDGKQVIAIENRTQAFSDTKVVAGIMEESFNRHLYGQRLEVNIRAKYHTHEFWDVVSEYEQGIASVKFSFPYPNLPEISDMVGEYYTDLAKRTNSEPVTFLNSTKKEKLVLEEGDLVLMKMIKAASASGKEIMMRPKGAMKWRRIGLETIAQEELPKAVLNGIEEQELIAKRWKVLLDFMDRIKVVYY